MLYTGNLGESVILDPTSPAPTGFRLAKLVKVDNAI